MRRPAALPEALSSQTVAIYARFSNEDLQREASIQDQVRTCTDAAAENGWLVEPSLVFRDAGISGAQMSTRDGIQTLLHRIESEKTKTFEGVIFDDSSRLGRNVAEVLGFCKLCEFHQVFLYFVNQELDSRDPNFYSLIMQFASGDEQFLKKLKQSVTRGQKGRIAEGMIHGGRYYGYKTVAIADPTKRSTASKIAIKGVKLVIDDVEASVVRAIFNWAEEGRSCPQIATACADANFPRPCTARGTAGIWTRDNVWGILTNRLYCGFLTYGKTTTWKHPVSGKVQMRPVPQSGWTINHFPDLAIVTTEQWDRVRSVIDSRKSVGLARMAGAAKRDKSAPISLLSGLLFCDQCGNPFVVAGKPRRDGRSLVCKSFRYERKKCNCSLGVDEALLETRLVEYLTTRILAHKPLDSAVECFHEALNAQTASADENRKKAEASSATLLREQNRLGKERENIIASLRELGPIESLKSEFARIEGRLKQVEDQLPRNTKPEVRRVPLEEARAFIHTQAHRLSEMLLADRNSVRQAILRHVGPLKLRLDAEQSPPTFHVKGDLHLSLNQLVMPSDGGTDFRQYYEEFTMTIDLDVPAWIKPLGPATTHAYDAAVADQIAQGAPTYISIARSQGISIYLVRAAAKRQNLRPTGDRLKVDPLNHPKVDLERVRVSRKSGMLFDEIACELRVSRATLASVLTRATAITGESFGLPERDPLNHPRVDLDRVRELRKAGMSIIKVARELQVSAPTLTKVMKGASALTGETFERTVQRPDPLNHPKIDCRKALELRNAGKVFSDIARRFNISVPTLIRVLEQACAVTGETLKRKMPLSDPLNHSKINMDKVREFRKAGLTWADIAPRFNVSASWLFTISAKVRAITGETFDRTTNHPTRSLTQTDLNSVRELWKAGKSTKEIAAKLNVLPNRLYRTLARVRATTGEDFRFRHPLNQSEVDLVRVRKLLKQGLYHTQIASELDLPRHRLRLVLKQVTQTTGEKFDRSPM